MLIDFCMKMKEKKISTEQFETVIWCNIISQSNFGKRSTHRNNTILNSSLIGNNFYSVNIKVVTKAFTLTLVLHVVSRGIVLLVL